MTKRITLRDILDHIHAMKGELVKQISGISQRMDRFDQRVDRLEQTVAKGFEDTNVRIQALQEDLDATIKLQGKHSKRLARL